MGFKAEQFVKSVDENLFCSICHDVFKDPVSCKDGHTFCEDCIHEWLKTNKKCPLDNGALAENQLVRVLMARGIIDNLEVYCHPCTQDEPSEVGDFEELCAWVGKLQNLPQHRKTCPFQEVQCPHIGCTETMQRRQLENHEKMCDFRKLECDECGMVLLQCEKEKHIRDDCLQVVISCPNRCQNIKDHLIEIKRIDLDDHLSKVCPKTLVDCPYKEQGCEVKVERQDVEKHVQENMAGHMMLLAKECSSLRKENSSLKEQCSSHVKKNSEVKNELKTLTRRCSMLKDELKQIREEFRNQLLSACSYTWTVRNCLDLSKKYSNGSCIESPLFWLRGYKWRLWFYPNGNKPDENEFLSLYLARVDDSLNPSSYLLSNHAKISFRISVISHRYRNCDVSEEATDHVFEETNKNWGWSKFMKASDALSPSYCNNGSLTIQCTILPK